MNTLYDGATDTPEEGKWYFFEYDPKWKDILKVWETVIQGFGLQGRATNIKAIMSTLSMHFDNIELKNAILTS